MGGILAVIVGKLGSKSDRSDHLRVHFQQIIK